MKKYIIISILILIFSITLDINNSNSATPSGTYLGEYKVGEVFYIFTSSNGFKVWYSFRGFSGTTILLKIMASPENPIISDGYIYLQLNQLSGYYILKVSEDIILQLVPYSNGNTIKVWKK